MPGLLFHYQNLLPYQSSCLYPVSSGGKTDPLTPHRSETVNLHWQLIYHLPNVQYGTGYTNADPVFLCWCHRLQMLLLLLRVSAHLPEIRCALFLKIYLTSLLFRPALSSSPYETDHSHEEIPWEVLFHSLVSDIKHLHDLHEQSDRHLFPPTDLPD